MSLIAAERTTSARSPWWCAGVGAPLAVGVNLLIASDVAARGALTVGATQLGTPFGLSVVLVMACLAVRARAVVVTVVGGLIGLAVAFGSWGLAHLFAPAAGLALVDGAAWRQVAGVGLVYSVAAAWALAVGILVRRRAAALSIVLGWALLAESAIEQVPGVGPAVAAWLPFHAAKQFLGAMPLSAELPGGPWAAAAWFAAVTAVLLAVAFGVARRREA